MSTLHHRIVSLACLGLCLAACGRSSEVQFGSGELHRLGDSGATLVDFDQGRAVPAGPALEARLELKDPEDLAEHLQEMRRGIQQADLAYHLDSFWPASQRIARLGTELLARRSGEDLAPLLDRGDTEAMEAGRPGSAFLVRTRSGGHAVVRVDEVIWQKSVRIRWAYRADGEAVFPDLSPLDSLEQAGDAQLDRQLFWAVRERNLAESRRLLAAGADPNHGTSQGPLVHWATSPEILGLLLEAGAEVDTRDPTQQTALHNYVSAGAVEQTRLLLASGANPAQRDHRGQTPIDLAAALDEPPRAEVMALLRGALPPGEGSLWVAARLGERERLRQLIGAGADIQAVDAEGRTPLHVAAYHGQLGAIRELLDAGADPSSVHEVPKSSLMLETPLVSAVRAGQVDAVRVLLPVSEETPPDTQRKALAEAIDGNHLEIARLLLDAGVDPELRIAKRQAPIFHVRERGTNEMVDLFQARGYEMTLWTMLRLGRTSELDRLIAAGADVDAPRPAQPTAATGAGRHRERPALREAAARAGRLSRCEGLGARQAQRAARGGRPGVRRPLHAAAPGRRRPRPDRPIRDHPAVSGGVPRPRRGRAGPAGGGRRPAAAPARQAARPRGDRARADA